jgi:chromosome segregation ATPase
MPAMDGNGVTITLREIYDSLNGVSSSLERLEQRIIRLEEKTSIAGEADERSREALKKAEEALKKADEALIVVKEQQREKQEFKKIWVSSVLTAVIPWLLSFIVALIYLVKKGGV